MKPAAIETFLKRLQKANPDPKGELDYVNEYTLLVAVVLSAQCTDLRVNEITPSLFKLADNPYDMVKLSIPEIQDIIRPCGLSGTKSKGIFGLSQMIVDLHGGKVPESFEELEAMPSVGIPPKFASTGEATVAFSEPDLHNSWPLSLA